MSRVTHSDPGLPMIRQTQTASELDTVETRVCCLDSNPKTAKITKKHNGHTRGDFVLIILLKKTWIFQNI